jgi:Ca2+-transporting ATPase
LAHKLDIKKDTLEEKWKFIEGLPFDSDRKLMSVIYKNPDDEYVALTKGAAEEVLASCSHVLEGGKRKELTVKGKSRFRKINTDMAGRGLRVLGMSQRKLPKLPQDVEPKTIEAEMTFLGMVGVLDPARPEAQGAVNECRQAGIQVIMVTGDHPATASNIAAQLGIFDLKKDKVMLGEEMDKLDENELCLVKPFPKVFARVSPDNKLMLINALRKMKYIVAMTGDGVNDAAAIKHANVGVAMGREGTDVTKQAADIILSDDNFATIVGAVEEGRRIFSNILKFIRYLLSCNMGNVFGILLATAFGVPIPFTAIQILWLNLVTDSPPALALGFDNAEKDAMTRPPRSTRQGFFRKADLIFIVFHALSMALIMLGVFLLEIYFAHSPLEKARTMAFATLVLTQLTQAFNAKSTARTLFRKDIFSNKWLVGAVLFSFALMILGMYLPILRGVVGQVELSLADWLKLTVSVLLFVALAEGFKVVRRGISARSKLLSRIKTS